MRVVIAGGTGLIGAGLTTALLDDGHEVVVLSRRRATACTVRPGLRLVRWQPPAAGAWCAELDGAAAVLNLAGASIGRWPWTSGRMRLLRESRLAATGALVDAIARQPRERRPLVLVSASGTDLYEGHDATPATEDAAPADSFLARVCLDWENAATGAESLGVRVVLVRTSSVIARGAPYLRAVSLPFRLLLGGRLGSGRQWVSWVDLADVVALYRFALETAAIRGPLNVSAPDPRPQAQYASALATALHRPCWLRMPALVIRLVLGKQATLVLGSRRVWPARALAAGYAFKRPILEESLAVAFHDAE